MKKTILLPVHLLLAGSLLGQDGSNAVDKKPMVATAPDAQVVLDLSDGSRIVGTPSVDRFKITTESTGLEIQLSQIRTIKFSDNENTAQVSLQNGDALNGHLDATEITMKTSFGQFVIPMAQVRQIWLGRVGGDFVNSLGMKFVRVPGTDVLFGIWSTRVQDYRAYAGANPGVDEHWKNPGVEDREAFKQGEDHPVVCVNWEDAKAFCAWLTKKEHNEGTLDQDREYRLPTDKEWSVAVGPGKYPWGDQWPPPKGAGYFAGGMEMPPFKSTFPVGTYEANQFGLYDMGEDALQWCEGWSDDAHTYRFARGISWHGANGREYVLSSFHENVLGDCRSDCIGFRCVLAPVSSSH